MAATAIVNVAMDNRSRQEVEYEEMLMKEPASLLVGRLKAMTWSARGKDAALREMRAQVAAARSREAAASAEAERLRAELAAARVAEERLAADMAEVEAEASHRIMCLEAELASALASEVKERSSRSHGEGGGRRRVAAEGDEEEAEAMMNVKWKEREEALLRRAQVAEAAEERLATQIAALEAEWHHEAIESRRMVESLKAAAAAAAAAATQVQQQQADELLLLKDAAEMSFEAEASKPFVASPAYLQAICESLLGTSSFPKAAGGGPLAKGTPPLPLSSSSSSSSEVVEKLGMRLKLWDSSTLVLQAAHT